MPYPYDSSKPTLVLVNSFTTSSELYRGQYANRELNDKMNLIAIEYELFAQTLLLYLGVVKQLPAFKSLPYTLKTNCTLRLPVFLSSCLPHY